MTVKLLAIAGSARTGSLNKRLAAAFANAANAQGADAQFIDIARFDLPIYNSDIEQDEAILARLTKLTDQVRACDGLFIACPEYNGSITPLLKNTLDWISRIKEGTPPQSALAGKTIALGATSMGAMGGLRGLTMMAGLMPTGYQAMVLPQTIAVPQGHERLSEDGEILHEGTKAMMETVAASLIKLLG